jgi:hypothetical protein
LAHLLIGRWPSEAICGGSRFPSPRQKPRLDRGTLVRNAGAAPPDLSRGSSSGCRGVARLPHRRLKRALWLSMYGPPMTDNGIYDRVVARTREGLGQAINPHLFRDCAVMSRALRSTTLPTLALRPACSGIAPDRQQNAITTKRAVSKRAVSCKNSFWRRNDVLGADDPTDTTP